jgi:hypothetical protein
MAEPPSLVQPISASWMWHLFVKLSLEVARRESLPPEPARFLCPIASSDVPVDLLVWHTSRVKGQMLRWVSICLAWNIHVCRLNPVLLLFVSLLV